MLSVAAGAAGAPAPGAPGVGSADLEPRRARSDPGLPVRGGHVGGVRRRRNRPGGGRRRRGPQRRDRLRHRHRGPGRHAVPADGRRRRHRRGRRPAPAEGLGGLPPGLRRRPAHRADGVGADGELEARCRALTARLGADVRAVVTGERQDVLALLPAFDVFALPSPLRGPAHRRGGDDGLRRAGRGHRRQRRRRARGARRDGPAGACGAPRRAGRRRRCPPRRPGPGGGWWRRPTPASGGASPRPACGRPSSTRGGLAVAPAVRMAPWRRRRGSAAPDGVRWRGRPGRCRAGCRGRRGRRPGSCWRPRP